MCTSYLLPPPSTCECFQGWGAPTEVTTYRTPDCSLRTCPSGKAWGALPTSALQVLSPVIQAGPGIITDSTSTAPPARTKYLGTFRPLTGPLTLPLLLPLLPSATPLTSPLLSSPSQAHGVAECSNMGSCNRETGHCRCMPGFYGSACERKGCTLSRNGDECSGHGRCVSMRQMAKEGSGFPISHNTLYEEQASGQGWDADRIYGCVCDSGWSVGLAAGQTQEAEWFGPDCSMRHCPSGEDPKGDTVGAPKGRNYLDCGATSGLWARGVGHAGNVGNLCQVDCSNRGNCDYDTGVCTCYRGFFGANCGIYSPDGLY